MKKLQQIVLVIGLCLIACSCAPSVPRQPDMSGMLAEYQGKWLIINYWAEWCGPCRIEVPALNAFYQMYKDKNVVVLGVNYDQEPEAKLKDTVARMNIQFPVLPFNPSKQLGLPRVRGIPTSFILTPDGELAATLVGDQTLERFQAAFAEAQQKKAAANYNYSNPQ